MKRFAGKFSLLIDGRKLVLWERRVGLISKDRTDILDLTGRRVPLPPEACMFFAIDRGDGTFVLQACNGEVLATNHYLAMVEVTTEPTRFVPSVLPIGTMRFDLALLRKTRASGKAQLRFYLQTESSVKWRFLEASSVRLREVDEITGARYVTNLSATLREGPVWTLVQHGDGIDEIRTSKKVTHFDFSAAGEAIVDLSGEDLTGVDFGRSDFSSAVLTGTVMKNASFKAAMFRKTLLDGATFEGATLDRTRFIEASMLDTTLKGVTGGGCDFSYCDLRTVKHGDVPLALTSTADAPLRFSYATLNYALVGPTWRHMHFDWASIENVPNDVAIDARNANLTGIALPGVTFGTSSKFDEAILRGASFVNATLPLASFRGAHMDAVIEPDFAPTDFGGARLQGSDFTDARCSHTNFSGARMDETQFNGATLVGTNFANAYLRGAAFGAVEQKKMSGAKFDHAFLVDANFVGADLSTYDGIAVNLTQAFLHNADFSNAKLAGTFMGAAGVAFESGTLTVHLGGRTFSVDYDPTIIDVNTTTEGTTCPYGKKGPCTRATLHTRDPFPTTWSSSVRSDMRAAWQSGEDE